MVIKLRQCCCGCSLKTGTLIIGVLDIICGLGIIIGGIRIARSSDDFYERLTKFIVGKGVELAVIGAILLVVAICLIIGAQKGIPALLMPWMLYTIVFLFTNTALHTQNHLRYLAIEDTTYGVGNIVAAQIYFLLHSYFLLVVYSLYRELKRRAPPNIV